MNRVVFIEPFSEIRILNSNKCAFLTSAFIVKQKANNERIARDFKMKTEIKI